jgi:hypothetical protein
MASKKMTGNGIVDAEELIIEQEKIDNEIETIGDQMNLDVCYVSTQSAKKISATT